ncbi:mitochondrial fission ELM1 family protein [Pseudoxanthomonas daejeonensis]|uniref:mitochondrial fission ELM1 family protein n=1 Tax=Pseudoxanthomonas daejeonensis TaxID=266062 RepID=UPI001F541646|nr:mitochondrial fission ELM1 family protein [Pseudoxanthomonas daejeonensis]UNK58273.1 mitochondrial fission ELM1 family protein [Pseudoxanthomonas daejeonensis]
MSFPQQTTLISTTWLLTDGHAGNVRQAEALARALGQSTAAPPLEPAAPWRWLAPRRLPGDERAFGPSFAAALAGHAPSLAIGCGRQGALATRLLRERGARTVQILDPRIDPRHWDLVVAPEHDGLHGANVIPLLGSLNPVDDAWLAEAALRFPSLLALPRPRIVLLVGGPTRNAPWTAAALEAVLQRLRKRVLAEGGSLLATASRRTPTAALELLRRQLRDVPGLLWEGSGTNPYPGMLACADQLVCTPDSVNMLSEACATDLPVQVLEAARAKGRTAAFLASLQGRGRIATMDAGPDHPRVAPLRETARVAAEVARRLGLDSGRPATPR